LGDPDLQSRVASILCTSLSLDAPTWISGTITAFLRFRFVQAPASGAFVVVIAMIETSDFFEDQVKQCRKLAAEASDKNDREFWLRLAHRWEGLLRAQKQDGAGVETVQKVRFERPLFTKRRRAA
jgi:hypothetical protein